MKKFKFKLATVLDARKNKENESLRNLASKQEIYQAELKRKEYLVTEYRSALERREQLANAPVKISAFLAEQDYISGTKQWILQADHAILRANRSVEKALKAYLFAKRQTRMIEIIYDHAYQDYKKQLIKQENNELDDLMIMRHRLKEEIL